LQARLDESLKIYKAGLAPKIYTVGSGAPGDRTTEAAASKNWLIKNGVKRVNILSITKGRDTLESTQAYAQVMKKATFNSVVIVTDPYHCFRSVKMANDQGLSQVVRQLKPGRLQLQTQAISIWQEKLGHILLI